MKSHICVPLIARGRTLGSISVLSTERIYTDEDLHIAKELGHRAGLAFDNARLFEAAQRAVRARDEFLSIASHELKTPLTPLKIQTQTLMRMAYGGSLQSLPPETLTKMMERFDRQVERLSKLIEEMLDISRINVGRMALNKEECDLAELVADVLNRFDDQLRLAGCEVKATYQSSAIGFWDVNRIEQVIINLLTNAMKYGAEHPIEVSVYSEAGKAVLVVHDHGIGIAHENQPRIFERFGRAASSTNYGGLGLGLYIVRQILRLHGGQVRVESKLGEGSTFTVELPAKPSSAAA